MGTQLLEIEPQELKFLVELKKQSSCSVRLLNKSNQHVAFKVKTTSPKKYCVRPNTGIVEPKSTCDFIVTMQAQRITPPDLVCKDKFLLQSTVVSTGTVDEDITSATFSKDDGKYVEEKKLRVTLISPPHSPILSPNNGTLKKAPAHVVSTMEDKVLNEVENFNTRCTLVENVTESKMENAEELEPAKDAEKKIIKDAELEARKDTELKIMKEVEEKLVKHIKEANSNLKELELKLSQAEVTIVKLTEENRLNTQEREGLRQELSVLRSKTRIRRVQVGFPLLYVSFVALVSSLLGYLFHRQ